ncbi:MAG: hypothetical protein L6Q54_04245 [Leptospiraceae bacterium]|nr:hypothetical protein [Leptospiraceae bacterium]MCK6380445.1 hypothetical protein [Leptospiraceae bacterium]
MITNKLSIALVILGFFTFCRENFQPKELNIQEVILCDNFRSDGTCLEKKEKNHTYEILIPATQKIDSWEKLGNFLYFHARETPGFLLKFNRRFTVSEKIRLKNSYRSIFRFSGIEGKVEGLEIGDDWIGSFQYLGSMLKERQRALKLEKSYPDLKTLFPADLKYTYKSELFTGEIETKISLVIKFTK